MAVDLTSDATARSLAGLTRRFVRETVLDAERAHRGSVHTAPEQVRLDLQAAARLAGVFCPQMSTEWGGLGVDRRGQALIFEEAGYSLLGPVAINAAAPDEGNMHLLEAVATREQKERYLRPLAHGEVRSCFAMTEPAPGAGSDPAALATTARRVSGGWVLDGRKWFNTGAAGAGFAIVMARTSGRAGDRAGATMFLVDAGTRGLEIVRTVDTLDESMIGGHGEIALNGCFVGDDVVLGEVDQGFDNAQVRLAPARLTHCMRWIGLARHAQELALDRATNRRAFGSRLAELGMVQQMLADNEIDLEASRMLILKAAWQLDRGESAAESTSIAKTFVAEAVGRVVDRSLQICGSLGVSGDLPLARYLREVRPFRIYDGPSETHRWIISRRAVARRARETEGIAALGGTTS